MAAKVTIEVAAIGLEKVRRNMAAVRKEVAGFNTSEKQLNVTRKRSVSSIKAEESALLRQLRAINTGRNLLKDLEVSLKRSNLTQDQQTRLLKESAAAFTLLTSRMSAGRVKAQGFQKAQMDFNNALRQTKRSIREVAPDLGDMKRKFTELSKSIQLALGPLSGIAARVTAFSGLMSQASFRVAGFIAALVGAGGLVVGAIKATAQIDKLRKSAQVAGLSFERFQEFAFVASQSGVRLEKFTSAMTAFVRRVQDARSGLGSAAQSFRELGFTIQELRDMNTDEIFLEVAERVKKYGDAISDAGIAADLFSRGQISMANVLKLGRDGIEKLVKEARDLGAILGEDIARDATNLQDALDKMSLVIKNNLIRAIAALVPTLTKVSILIAALGPVIKRNIDLIITSVAILGGVLLGGIFGPTGALIGGALAGGFALAATNAESLLKVVKEIQDDLRNTRLTGLIDDLPSGAGKNLALNTFKILGADAAVKFLEGFFSNEGRAIPEAGAIEKGLGGLAEFLQNSIDKSKNLAKQLAKVGKSLVADPVNKALLTTEQQLANLNIETARAVTGITTGINPAVASMAVQLGVAKASAFALTAGVGTLSKDLFELSDRLNELQLRKEALTIFKEAQQPIDIFANRIKLLDTLLSKQIINLDLYTIAVRRAKDILISTDPVLSTLSDSFGKFSDDLFEAFTDSENAMESLRKAAKTLVDSILKEFLRLAAIKPLLAKIFGTDPGPGIGGILGSLGSLFGGLGSGAAATGGGGIGAPVISGATSAFAAHGGTFRVKGSGLSDRPVPLHARPGELIKVTTPEVAARGGNGGDTFIIDARGADQTGLKRLEDMIRSLNGSIENRAVAATVAARDRAPQLFGG